MWLESPIDIDGRRIGISVERLDDDARERTAAQFALLTLEAVRNTPTSAGAWTEFVGNVLVNHVAFSVAEVSPDALGAAWWEQALGRALLEFVELNGLAPRINRHIDVIRDIERTGRTES